MLENDANAFLAGFTALFLLTFTVLMTHPEILIPPRTIHGESTYAMEYGLKSIVSSGYGTTYPQKIRFYQGETIDAQTIIDNAPIQANEIAFTCPDDLLCGPGKELTIRPLTQTNNSGMTVKQNTQAYVVTCGNADAKQNPKYCIAIGRTDTEAKMACTTACHMTG